MAEELPRLEQVAQQLVGRIHDDDPEANLRWLRAQLGTDQRAPMTDTERLLFVVATAVPITRTWKQLTAWTRDENTPEVQALRREALRQAMAPRRKEASDDGTVSTRAA